MIEMTTALHCRIQFLLLLAVPLLSGGAFAREKPSVEKGRQLFSSTAFAGATSGKSCSECHPGGSGLQFARENPNLAAQINNCIAGPLKGSMLDENSVEMQSMLLYVRSLKQ